MFSKVIKSLAVVSALLVAQNSYADALSLKPNTSYELTGTKANDPADYADNGLFFLAFYQTPHGSELHQGDFYAYFNLTGSMTTGEISGNNLSSLSGNIFASLVNVVRYNGTAWEEVSGATGTATSTFNYSNITINENLDIFALIKNTGSGTGTVDLNLSHSGITANLNETVNSSFMPFDEATQGYYDPAINAFSLNGVLDFATAGFNSGIHSWFDIYSQVLFGSQLFYLQGDIHAKYSEVPEPASMGLLTAGLMGVLTRRRKKIAA
jgi:hypothetical protein